MSDASQSAFQPVSGKLGQMIYENPGEGIEPRLEFFIEVGFETAEIDDETGTPLLRASNIVISVNSWRLLENSSYEFPWAPKPGAIDAAMVLFREQNPADVTKLEFGAITNGKIAVSFNTEVDFEIEADCEELGQVELSLNLPLEITPLRVATSLEKRFQSDSEAITKAVSTLIDLADFEPIEKVPGGFEFPIATVTRG